MVMDNTPAVGAEDDLAYSDTLLTQPKRPMDPPFVGKVISAHVDSQQFPSTRKNAAPGDMDTKRTLVLFVDPLNAVAYRRDGFHRAYWKESRYKNSAWGILMAHTNAVLGEAYGNPGFIMRDYKTELVGQTLMWEYRDGTHPMWDTLDEKFRPQKPVLVPIGIAPAGWEATIPADLEALKREAMARVEARARDDEAGRGFGVSTPAATTAPIARAEAPSLDLSPEATVALVEFLRGRSGSHTDIFLAAMKDANLRAVAGDVAVKGLANGSTQGTLIAQSLLSKGSDGSYS